MAGSRPKTLIDRLPPAPVGEGMMAYITRLREGDCKITLDAGRVEVLAPEALEGLLVIAAEQRARGHPFVIENPSEAFTSDLALYGVTDEQLKGQNP
ncbi:MAG: STAS domain-containing protein [Pseudomonadota bacterium]